MKFFEQYYVYLPYIILAILLLSGGLLLRAMYSYSSAIYRLRTLGRAMGGPFSFFQRARAVESVASSFKTPFFRRVYNRFLSFLLFLGITSDNDPLSLSFSQAIKILKQQMGKRNYQYKLPWFLMLGAAESGKSTILESAELDLPVGSPRFATKDKQPTCKWWFFDRGIVLDLVGNYFLEKGALQNDKSGWSRLVSLLLYHRPRRPIDGIILTIPSTELLGSTKLPHDEVIARAKHIHTKLWHIQKSLGMKIPVYVLVTKTDLVPGFKGFTEELPRESLYQMLGWSSPYSLESGYEPSWVDQVFDTVRKSLHAARAEIFAAGRVKNNRDDTLIFKVELLKLKENLSTFLNQIFQESAYHESFFLRGIYFCGDTRSHTAVGDYKREERSWTTPEAMGAAAPTPFKQHDKFHVSFLRDLLEKKVFLEYALARPIKRVFKSASRLLNLTKVFMVIFLLVWGIGLYRANNRLSEGKSDLLPLVNEVAQTLHHMRQRDFDVNAVHDAKYLNDQTLVILNQMTGLEVENSFSLAIPTSWFTSYDERLKAAFTTTWDSVVFVSLYTGLTQKARSLFVNLVPEIGAVQPNYFLPPLKTPEFLDLLDFVKQTGQWEYNVLRFNNLESSLDIEDIGRLVRYLFNQDLPAQFYTKASYYQSALATTQDRNISLKDYNTSAHRKLRLLYSQFIERVFDPARNFGGFTKLSKMLEKLEHSTAQSRINEAELRNTVQFLAKITGFIGGEHFQWIKGYEFDPGPLYSDVLNRIAQSRMLGTELANEFLQETQKEFSLYKNVLASLTAPLIGPVFTVENNKVLPKPSPTFDSLVEHFTAFMKEPFMAPMAAQREVTIVPPGRMLFWDTPTLKGAAKLVTQFESFLADTAPKLSQDVRHIMEYIGRRSVLTRLLDAIARAERFKPIPQSLTGFDEQEALRLQIHNLKTVHPLFAQILGGYVIHDVSSQAASLRELLIEETYKMLEGVDRLLIRDDLYGISNATFESWRGERMLGLQAFGVHDLEDMKSYLNAQRERIFFLSKELAAPVLSFLGLPFLNGVPRNMPLVSKWTRIVLQLDAYEKKTPNNSLSILEHFLLYDINQFSLDSCFAAIRDTDAFAKTGDFFIRRRNEIKASLLKRCKSVAEKQGSTSYQKLASFFNQKLAGRFPFTEKAGDTEEKEASEEDVKVFLTMFESINPVEKEAISERYQSKGKTDSPVQFLRQIRIVSPYLRAALSKDAENHVSALLFDVDFRSDRSRETGGNKIIDWFVLVNGQKVSLFGKKHTGSWDLGDKVQISLNWAGDSNTIPTADSTQKNLNVKGHQATFSYSGNWSLLHLLRNHITDSSRHAGPSPLALEFSVPTIPEKVTGDKSPQPDSMAKVFLSFAIFAPPAPTDAQKEGGESEKQTLAYPIFPHKAPVVEAAKG
ncbi:MAG: type VI secretion system protein [Pseudomonadota bacterium]